MGAGRCERGGHGCQRMGTGRCESVAQNRGRRRAGTCPPQPISVFQKTHKANEVSATKRPGKRGVFERTYLARGATTRPPSATSPASPSVGARGPDPRGPDPRGQDPRGQDPRPSAPRQGRQSEATAKGGRATGLEVLMPRSGARAQWGRACGRGWPGTGCGWPKTRLAPP